MANKEKLLAAAQKSLQKGQVPRAIKDYQKIVEIDPRDVRSRQKLAELHSRARNQEKALAEYETVAKYYSENGFYLKAIAVYKQMQKLDPSLVNIYHRLAELNEKQGLNGNALAEYRTLVSFYEKQQMIPEAINVLQKMKDIDPENLNIRVKIAETYAQAKLPDKARAEVLEVRNVLMQKKDFAKVFKLYDIFLPMFPQDPEMQIGLGQALLAKGDTQRGIEILQEQLSADVDNPSILSSLVEGYRKLGDFANERLIYQRLLEKSPADLDLRQGYIKACFKDGAAETALEELDEWKEAFFDEGRVAELKDFFETLKEALPGNELVLQNLHSIYEITGEGNKLFDILSTSGREVPFAHLAGAISSSEETLDDSILDDAVDDLDEFEELPDAGQESVAGEEALADIEDAGVGDSLDALEEIPLEFLEEETSAGASLEISEELELELELELEDDLEQFDPTGPEPGTAPAELSRDGSESSSLAPEPEIAARQNAGEECLELNFDEELLDVDFEEDLADVPGLPTEIDVEANLEEAEFYLQQGLLDEADRICQGILEAEPENRRVREKLVEVETRRKEVIAAAASEDYVDLAAEIAQEATPRSEAAGSRMDRFGLDSAFNEFKKGVQSQIDVDDAESHYNLGIAYREMGLLDDAITEFDQALGHPERRVDCLTLKGVCLLDKGATGEAEEAFKQGLSSPDLSVGEKISLHFELGQLYEASGRLLEALDSFQLVADNDMFFRDVGDRVHALRKQLGLEEDRSSDDDKAKGNKNRVSYV